MRTVTLEKLIERVLDESDMHNSDFVDNNTIIDLINDANMELRADILTGLTDTAFFTASVTLQPDAQGKVLLPTGFFNLKNITTEEGVRLEKAANNTAPNISESINHLMYSLNYDHIKLWNYNGKVVLYYGVMPDMLEEMDDTLQVVFNEDRIIAKMAAKDIMRWEETSLNDISDEINKLTSKLHKVLTKRDLRTATVTKVRRRTARSWGFS